MRPRVSLSLWKQHLGAVPEEVWDRTDLDAVVLADNDLTEVSERIGGLGRLRMLDLGHNRLEQLPEALGELQALSDYLYLHDNRLSGLPTSLGRLTRLRYLNLSENAFVAFPEPVLGLESLIELRITDNRLTTLPAALPRLEKLDLRWVTTLPEIPWLADLEARGCAVYL